MGKPTKARKTSGDVREALRQRFAPPAWAVLEEVGNATGFGTNRHIDMMAMSVWPSRGLELYGIEIKVDRHDVQRELRAPDKAEPIQKYCDRWWLAVSDKDLVKPGELPPTWGLLALRGKQIVCVKEAPKLKPKPLDRAFLAALLRRSHEAEEGIRAEAFSRGREKGIAEGPEEAQRRVEAAERSLANYEKGVKAFEAASGIQIDQWSHYRLGDVGAVVEQILAARDGHFHNLRRFDPLEIARGQVNALRNAAELLDKACKIEEKERALVQRVLDENAATALEESAQ